MSHPSRPRATGTDKRRPRNARFESIVPLEQRQLLAPFVTVQPITAATSATVANRPKAATNLGVVTFTTARSRARPGRSTP